MTAFAFAVVSDRAADQVLLVGNVDNTDGENVHNGSLPAGFGDCILLEGGASIDGNATLTNVTNFGARVVLAAPGGQVLDWIDAPPIYQIGTARAGFEFKPDQAIYWKAGETLELLFPEIDTNVAPTGDMTVFVKVRRIRQSGGDRVRFLGPFTPRPPLTPS